MNGRIRALSLVGAGVLLGVLLSAGWRTYSSSAQTAGGCQTFPQTGYTVCGKFLDYWQKHGGLAQQGYPISQQFTETSSLNGKPYTVQYFERAVFELHPENQPPNDVLLSQLGTYLGKQNYTKGFPKQNDVEPYYENRNDPVAALKSYYNAINLKDYERAYSYFRGAPNPDPSVAPPYSQFVAGYADTASVTLAVGKVQEDAGAGNIYASIPVVLTAKHTDGSTHVYAGCYILHRVSDGISQDPNDELWSIQSAKLTEAPANSSVDTLLAQPCAQ